MNSKNMVWMLALVLALPAVRLSAQEGPGHAEEEEIEINEGGPGMAPGGRGGMWVETEEDEDEGGRRQMTVRVRKGGPVGPAEMGEQGGGPGRKTVKVRKMMGPGGMGMGPGGMRGAFMNEEETLASVKKHDPAFAKKLEELKTNAPAKYRMALGMGGKLIAMAKMEEDAELEKDAVRGMALEFDSKELSRKYNKASDPEKAAIKTELKAKLGELFDLKSKGQELRVKRMEKDIAKHKANLDKRKANKAKIVEQRLDQLTGEGTGW